MILQCHARSVSTLLLALLLLLGPAASCRQADPQGPAPLRKDEAAFYAIQIGGRTIGYSAYRVTGCTPHGQRELCTVESRTVIKVDVAGETQTVDYQAKTLLATDWTPERYELTVERSGEVPGRITAARGPEAWHLSAVAGPQQEKDIPLAEAGLLLDYNLFEQYAFLLRATPLAPGQERRVRVLAPQGFTALEVCLSVGQDGRQITAGGRTAYCLPVMVGGEQLPAMTLWMTPERELLRLELAEQNLVVELSDERVAERVQSVDLAALMAGRSAASNVQFSAYWNVTRLRARLEVKVAGERVDLDSLTDARQAFTGTVEDGWVRGTVTTQPARYALAQAPGYPVQGEADPALAAYLQAEEDIEAGDPAIVAKAQELATGASTTWQAALAIGEWVHQNIAYEITAGGARACLRMRRGDCGPQTRLVMAMCRAVGIPARMVGGLMYGNGRFGQHYWAEVHLGQAGWVPIDATTGEFGTLDATHIRLWQAGTVEALTIEVLEYEDRGSAGALLPRRPLGLVAGERYTYRFTIQGQEAGQHTWEVVGPETLEGQEAFHVRAHLDLSPARLVAQSSAEQAQARLVMDADLWVDGEGRPLRYQAHAQTGTEAPTVEVRFGEQGAHEEVTAHGRQVVKDVPLPAGTYLLANHMAGWLALLYRSLELQPGRSLAAPVFFAENLTGQVVHLNIGEQLQMVEVGGRRYECLVVEVPECAQVDYVTPEGLLVRSTVPGQGVVIDLVQVQT